MKLRSLLIPPLGAGLGLSLGAAANLVRRAQRNFNFRDRTVVISGGSRGLGLSIARQLGRRGARLVLFARDPEELDRAQGQLDRLGCEAITFAVDATRPAQVERAIEGALAARGHIDALFNVQGSIQVGPLANMSREIFEESMAVNYGAAFNLIWAVLPEMRKNKHGRIVNVASIGGEIAIPHLSAYSASKFALTGLSMALHTELRKHGIVVTTVTPTLMRTGSPRHADVVGRVDDEATWFTTMASLPGLSMDVERAAARIIRATQQGRASTTLSAQGRALSVLSRLFPETFADAMVLFERALPPEEPWLGTMSKKAGRTWSPARSDDRTAGISGFAARVTEAAAARNNQF